jgi:hypothetical protein
VAIDAVVARRVQLTALEQGSLLVWTVYDHPRDFPDHWIARPHLTEPGQTEPLPFHLAASTLDALRVQLPSGLVCLTRSAGDDPRIVETWL